MAVGFTALLAAGCTVGPDYVPPDLEVPERWRQAMPAVEAAAAGQQAGRAEGQQQTETVRDTEIDGAWWEGFGDPMLTDLVRRAAAGNPSLRVAFTRIQQSRAIVQQVSGQYQPDIDANGGYSRSRDSARVSPFPVQTLDTWNVGVGAFWEIDLFGRIRRSVESADAAFEAAAEDYNDVLRVLQAEVAEAYVQLRTLQRRILLLRQNVDLQRESRDLAKARFETEIAPELDVFQAESNLANTEAQMPGLELQLAQVRHRIAVLLGEHAGSLDEELSAPQPLPKVPAEIEVGIPGELLRRRPDVRRAERQLASQTARIGATESQLYPQLELTAALSGVAFGLDRVLTNQSRAWNVSPGVRLNLFQGGRIRAAIREEEALTEAALIGYENTVLLAVEETENAIAALRLRREQRLALARVVTAAARSSELARELYKQGLRSFQNVLDAERTRSQAQDALADLEGAEVAAAIRLYRALGGGWRQATESDPE
ncbi:MAG: efflux transporter outer membrane subunit [bacterium]|nr:efflux transporter outer membrane subunit [bacterium]